MSAANPLMAKLKQAAANFEAKSGDQKVLAVIKGYLGIFVVAKVYGWIFGKAPAPQVAEPVKAPVVAKDEHQDATKSLIPTIDNLEYWLEHSLEEFFAREDIGELLEKAIEDEMK
jgi:hypothetical protein